MTVTLTRHDPLLAALWRHHPIEGQQPPEMPPPPDDQRSRKVAADRSWATVDRLLRADEWAELHDPDGRLTERAGEIAARHGQTLDAVRSGDAATIPARAAIARWLHDDRGFKAPQIAIFLARHYTTIYYDLGYIKSKPARKRR